MTTTEYPSRLAVANPRRPPPRLAGWWWWAAVPFAAVYLVLLAVQFSSVITSSNLDADAVSAPVIGQLFAAAPAHAQVVLGTFGWYATLLFELATKWLPLHRQVWEAAPYAMAIAGVLLTAWPVYVIAGRVAASLTAVILFCASPRTLDLLLSMTQHAPVWFSLSVLGAFLFMLERHALRMRPLLLGVVVLAVGVVVGANAASDPLVTIAGLVPFCLALGGTAWLAPEGTRTRSLVAGAAMLLVVALSWVGTDLLMSALNVIPEPGQHTGRLAAATQIGTNFRLWWQSIARLGSGDFFGRDLNFTTGLAAGCAALSIGAVVLLPWLGWGELRRAAVARPARSPEHAAFVAFWCVSAVLLSAAFLLSALPVDAAAARYLVGLVYAAAAVIPTVAARRPIARGVVLVGTCVFALSSVISMAQRQEAKPPRQAPGPRVIPAIEQLAAREHLRVGYAGYWDAAPITWGTDYRVHVYPVSVCDRGEHLCPFDLHYISSWYEPRPGIRSFLVTDSRTGLVPAPTPDLGRPLAIYRLGQATMYVYPYDVAQRLSPT